MESQTITINLPQPIYQRIKQRAEQTQRTIEDELLEVVTTAVPEEALPTDLAHTLAALALLDDKTLWQAARSHLPTKSVLKMEQLHHKRGRGIELNQSEKALLVILLQDYDKFMLIRAEAMRLLIEHGHDISKLIKKLA